MKHAAIAGFVGACALIGSADAQVPPGACDTVVFATGQYAEIVSQRHDMLVSINERRDILGHWSEDDPALPDGFYSEAFLVRGHDYIPIAVPGAQWTLAVDMNAQGVVVGNFRDADSQLRGFRWERGAFTIIEVPDSEAYATFVQGINAAGTIVGRTYLIGGGLRGYVYRGGSYETVKDAPGWSRHSYAADVNNQGAILIAAIDQTVAWYLQTRNDLELLPVCPTETTVSFADGGGFLTTVRLDGHEYGALRSNRTVTLYEYPGARYTYIWDVNAQGEAVGVAYDVDYTQHVFVYTPPRSRAR